MYEPCHNGHKCNCSYEKRINTDIVLNIKKDAVNLEINVNIYIKN